MIPKTQNDDDWTPLFNRQYYLWCSWCSSFLSHCHFSIVNQSPPVVMPATVFCINIKSILVNLTTTLIIYAVDQSPSFAVATTIFSVNVDCSCPVMYQLLFLPEISMKSSYSCQSLQLILLSLPIHVPVALFFFFFNGALLFSSILQFILLSLLIHEPAAVFEWNINGVLLFLLILQWILLSLLLTRFLTFFYLLPFLNHCVVPTSLDYLLIDQNDPCHHCYHCWCLLKLIHCSWLYIIIKAYPFWCRMQYIF